MINRVTTQNVADTIERPLTPDEERVIPTWIDRAWRILLREVPGLEFRNSLPDQDPEYLPIEDIEDVVISMVERKVRNSDGLRTWGGDDYSQTIDAALSSGQLYVSDKERAALAPRGLAATDGAYSIPLGY